MIEKTHVVPLLRRLDAVTRAGARSRTAPKRAMWQRTAASGRAFHGARRLCGAATGRIVPDDIDLAGARNKAPTGTDRTKKLASAADRRPRRYQGAVVDFEGARLAHGIDEPRGELARR